MPSSAHIALVQPSSVREEERDDIRRITDSVCEGPASSSFSLVTNPNTADLVILLEANIFFGRDKIPYYSALPWVESPHRLCVVNYEDRPAGFLPGMYTSLHTRNFDHQLHVSWPALRYYNDLLENEAVRVANNGPASDGEEWLYSFVGSAGNAVRRAILEAPGHLASKGNVVEINRWYNHTDEEKQRYVDLMSSSSFVLCPRGVAAYSHRILEALALGKVPVVIADEWVPFSIPADDYYIRVQEADASRVPAILRYEYASAASSLKAAAHAVYRKYFDVRWRYRLAFERLLKLQEECLRNVTREDLLRRWRSGAFWRANGWAFDQRAIRRVRDMFRTR
jgi:hypothetical protein